MPTDDHAKRFVNHSRATPDHMHALEFIDYQESGWPFTVMSCDEIVLTNCPNIVLPAAFKARDTILIDNGHVKAHVVFDAKVYASISCDDPIPLTWVWRYEDRPLSDLLDMNQLRDHPVMAMTIVKIEAQGDGYELELR